MVLDSKFDKLKHHFGIWKPEQWTEIRPEAILQLDGIGPVTLDHVRLFLAARGLTLKDDQTPQYWNANLSRAKIGQVMGSEDLAVTTPFTVLVDSQEQHPFTFEGLSCDSDRDHLPMIVAWKWKSLGTSMGDYSIEGYEGLAHIERKSQDDAHGTILGWDRRRERFERELANLSGMPCAAVVVECTLQELLDSAPDWGKKPARENRKILFRQVLAWQMDYRVPWFFCDWRRLAEITCFRLLERFWKKTHARRCLADKTSPEVKQLIAAL